MFEKTKPLTPKYLHLKNSFQQNIHANLSPNFKFNFFSKKFKSNVLMSIFGHILNKILKVTVVNRIFLFKD